MNRFSRPKKLLVTLITGAATSTAQLHKVFLLLFVHKKKVYLILAVALWPGAKLANPPAVANTPAALRQAQHEAAAHKAAAAAARAKQREDAARAAILAEQQIEAAAALRRLENQTGDDASALAGLQAQVDAAQQSLAVSQAALTKLLPVMQRLSGQPAATMLAIPASPTDAVRGLIVIQGIAAQLEQQAAAVKRQSANVMALLGQAQAAQDRLSSAVAVQQEAETRLSAQIMSAKAAEMADADKAAAETAAAIAADAQAGSIQAVINKLAAAQQATIATPGPPPAGAGGAPVSGTVIQSFGADTLAGPAVGVSYRAAPGARVVTPCAGPVLFADRFQSYGMLVIVGCGAGYDFVLSGMQSLDVTAGQTLAHGQPVGEMLGYNAKDPAHQPVLYVELRQNGTPVDPSRWLNLSP